MDAQTHLLARTIGARVKQERQHRKWTLDQLAAQAEISRRMLVNVEQGTANPSVGTLLRLSDALGVGLPALVEPPTADPVKITRRGEGAELWTGERGGSGLLLGGTKSPHAVELWQWTLLPGEEHRVEPHSTGTIQLLQVQQGRLTLQSGSEIHELSELDAASYPGDVFHCYSNPGDIPARYTMAVYEPGSAAAARPHGAA